MAAATAAARAKAAAHGAWRVDLALIFALGLIANGLAARFITEPGYVDAYYYFGGAAALARGEGFTQPYVWNYLENPPGTGEAGRWPSHLYWMPLASMVAAPFVALAEAVAPGLASAGELFRAAQAPFIVAAAVLPWYAYGLAWRVTGRRRPAWAAALLTLFSPFHFIYWTNTDTFALHALAAGGALLAVARAAERGGPGWHLLAGLAAGLAHLARADGVLMLGVAALAVIVEARGRGWALVARRLAALALGYGVVMAPWLARNVVMAGAPLPAAGTRTLWLVVYDEIFAYDSAWLTPARYFAAGWPALLRGKWEAVQNNLGTLVAVQGGVAAFPFSVVGLWQLRRVAAFRWAVVYGLALLAAMTFVFTFPGMRGGYFHSGAALVPFLAAAAVVGVEAAVEAASRRLKHWKPARAARVFTIMLAALTAVLAVSLFYGRVIGPDPRHPAWAPRDPVYAQAGAWLAERGQAGRPVAVNNPPGWHYHTGQPAIVIPYGDVDTLLQAMNDFDARWVFLDINHPAGLAGLYAAPESEPRLALRAAFEANGAPAYLLERVDAP